jgi:branched-chain amino acid transport system ATP-binding protein
MLAVEDLTTGYGLAQVLRGASISIQVGERVGLFGPNGHGKTTLLRAVSGLLEPWSGTIRFDAKPVVRADPASLLDQGLVHVPQANTLFPRMTVAENLAMGAYAGGRWRDRRRLMERVFEVFPNLSDRGGQSARTLSGGERQMVAIGVGIMAEPRMLLLDEPTLGLAPRVKDELASAIQRIASSGVTLLVVDQDVEFLLAITDRLYLLEQGRVVFESRSDTSIEDARIMSMYFGTAL